MISVGEIILVTQKVKNLLGMYETQIRSLCGEDFLENEMAGHSDIFAQWIPWTKEAGGLLSMGSQRITHNWATSTFIFHFSLKITHTHRAVRANKWNSAKLQDTESTHKIYLCFYTLTMTNMKIIFLSRVRLFAT